jgi:acetoin utilization protein AcuB
MLVTKRMTLDPVSIAPDAPLGEALRLTREHRIRHLPVVSGGDLVGIVSDRDLRLALPSSVEDADAAGTARVEESPVSGVMTANVITVGPGDTLEDAAVRMRRHRVGALPVVDAAGALLGIVTESDVIAAFVEVFTASGPSSRLEIALTDRAGELSRAVRVIGEELRLNINSIMVNRPDRPGGERIAVVHVATIDPREAIAALRRIGCTVGWPTLASSVEGF